MLPLLLALLACDRDGAAPDALPELPPRPPAVQEPRGEPRPLKEATLALTGEVRGEIEPCGCPTVPYGGFRRRANFLARLRAEGPPVFTLDAGMMLVRGLAARDGGDRLARARAVLGLAEATGLDAWAASSVDLRPGGLALLREHGALAANWRAGDGSLPLAASRVLERDGFRLGVIGLADAGDGVVAGDPVAAVREAMRGDADAWVVLSSAGDAENRAVAESVAGLGAVLALRGAAHDPPRATEGAPIVETPDRGRYVSVLRLALAAEPGAWTLETGGPVEDLAGLRRRAVDLAEDARAALAARLDETRARLETHASGRNLVLVEHRPLGSELDRASAVDARIDAFKTGSRRSAADRARAAPEGPRYAPATCAQCHGDRLAGWAFDDHAKAQESLLRAGEQTNPECVGCHTTAWGEPGGNADLTPAALRTWKAVQCEACHGPMAGHPDDPSVHGRAVGEDTCRACHDEANSPQFDYGSYLPRISCSRM